MADIEELRLLLTTQASTLGATQTRDALRQVRVEADQTRQALSAQQQLANTVLRQSAGQGGVSAANLQSLRDQIQKQVGAAPTLSASDLGIKAAVASAPTVGGPSASAINDTSRALRDAEAANRQHAAAVRASELANREHAASLRSTALAARQATQVNKEFTGSLNPGDFLRFAGALAGVQIGLSLFTSAGRAIRDTITGASDALIETQRVARATAASYGSAAEQFTRFAAALSAQTGFTKNAILEAALSARTLSDNYGLSVAQTQKLISVSADLARIRGIGVAEAFERVQSAIRGEAEASEFLGLTLNATFLKNNAANGTLKNTFETMTDGQKAQVVYAELLRQADKFQGLATSSATGLEAAQRDAALASTEFANNLGTALEPTLIAATKGVEGLTRATDELIKRLTIGTKEERLAAQLISNREEMGKLVAQVGITQNAFGVLTDTATGQLASVEVLADRLGVSWDDLLAVMEEGRDKFSGSAEGLELVRASITRLHPPTVAAAAAGQQLSGAFSIVDETMQRVHRSISQVAKDVSDAQAGASDLSAILDALSPDDTKTRSAIQAQLDLGKVSAQINAQRIAEALELERAREREATKISDPRDAAGANAARQRLQVLDQLIPAELARADALKGQADAQAQVTALDVAAQQRQLEAAQPLADLRTETLLREVQIADVQQKEADLAERITLASRSNLDLTRQIAQSKLDSLATDEALNDNQFESKQLALENKAIRADVRRGVLDRSALDDIRPNRQRITELRREAPRLEFDAATAARPGELLARQATRDQLDQTIRLSILEQQKRVLDDQLTPLRQAQALTDARTAAIQRQLELQTLAETSARSAASLNLTSANAVLTAADAAVKKSIEFGANVGATMQNVEQTYTRLATIPPPQLPAWPATPGIIPGGPAWPSTPGVPPGGFTSPTSTAPTSAARNTTTINVTNNFTGPVNDPQAIAQEILTTISNGIDQAPRASSVGLTGAI